MNTVLCSITLTLSLMVTFCHGMNNVPSSPPLPSKTADLREISKAAWDGIVGVALFTLYAAQDIPEYIKLKFEPVDSSREKTN